MSKINIFGDDEPESSSKETGFNINKSYASRYNNWRRLEEIQKLKDIYGDAGVYDSASTSESEDEDAKELTASVEKGWLKAFSALKSKDPKIYQKNVKFYISDDESDASKVNKRKKKKKEKPIYLQEYETKLVLENEGDGKKKKSHDKILKGSQYDKDNEELRKSIVDAMKSDSDDGSGDDLLVPRKKTIEEEDVEDTDYIEWLKGEEGNDKKKGNKDLEPLKKYWSDPNLTEAEKYLKDFILNKRYIDKDAERIPTYNEVVNSDDDDDDDDEISEEDEVKRQEDFERTYNFRFEEPGADIIKTFPGVIEDSVRRKDTRRSDKRALKRDRHEEEKDRRKEELLMLKKMKRQEIEQKINRLKEITGNNKVGFSPADLEEDFDPKAHDKMMQQYFTEDYYGEEEEDKPLVDGKEDELVTENWDAWQGDGEDQVYAGEVAGADQQDDGADRQEDQPCGQDGEEVNFNMDADYDPSLNLLPKKRKRKRSKFAEALAVEKPTFNPNKKSFDKYLDEYYKLDYEDMIGDMPCRFKYRTVAANDYGLTTAEVLSCPARELNAWVSLKKMSQYRSLNAEKKDKVRYKKKAKDHTKKLQYLPSLEQPEEEAPSDDKDKDRLSGKTVAQGKKDKSEKVIKKEKRRKDKSKIEEAKEDKSTRKDKDDIEEKVKEGKEKSIKKSKKKKKLQVEGEEDTSEQEDLVKNKKTKKRKHSETVTEKSDASTMKKQKKRKSGGGFKKQTLGLSDDRLRAYGIDPQKARFMNIDPLGPKYKA